MNKPNLTKIANSVRTTLVKHSPEILTGIGITGMLTTVVLAVRATPMALVRISQAEDDKFNAQVDAGKDPETVNDKLTALETIKATWKCYIPAAVTGTMSTVCLIGASSVSAKRNAALTTAYTLADAALKDYQEKTVETIGEKKEQAIRDAIAKDKLEKDPVTEKEVIITGSGTTRCYDSISGRYFESDVQTIRTAESSINRRLIHEMYISLNEFYWELGLEGTEIGDQLGWNIDNPIELGPFSSQVSKDGVPCLVINYRISPKYGFASMR